MPYTVENPPATIKNLPKAAQRLWIEVFNQVYEETNGDDNQARIAAWGAVKRRYKKVGDKWVLKTDIWTVLDEIIVKAKSRLAIDNLIEELKGVLTKTWDEKSREAIIRVVGILQSIDRATLAPEELELIENGLSRILGTSYAEAVRKPVVEIQEAAYLMGAREATWGTGVSFAWMLPDRKSLEVLNEDTLFWVGSHYGDNIQSSIRESLQKYFTGRYQRREVMWDLKLALQEQLAIPAKFKGTTDQYWDLLADHTCTKIREIGRVSGYEQAGIEIVKIKAVLDERTTQICRRMHGRIISVKTLRKQVDKYLDTCRTKDKEKIKKAWPWWDDSKAEKLSMKDIQRNIKKGKIGLPPYHARCRTITVAEFKGREGDRILSDEDKRTLEELENV